MSGQLNSSQIITGKISGGDQSEKHLAQLCTGGWWIVTGGSLEVKEKKWQRQPAEP